MTRDVKRRSGYFSGRLKSKLEKSKKEETIMTTNSTRLMRQSLVGAILVITALLLMPVIQAWAVDYDGPKDGRSLIGAVRLIPESSYVGVPELLEKYIKEKDETAWSEIKEKINYTYRNLGHALKPVLRKGNLKGKIRAEVNRGKKLFFKPNLVNPEVLSLAGDGSPGSTTGLVACTDWAFVAALMRFFHDKLEIPYYQMAIGEAGTMMPAYSALIGCTPEALIEGTPFGVDAGYWAGWPFYFVRKYLAETTTPLGPNDDPMNGYEDSITGDYVTPGKATLQGKLMVYDLNNAESFDRGRLVDVPDGGDNYDEIIIHKALVGDPGDLDNYPGSVLVNCPILKVHIWTTLTNAIKNLGIGGWPMCAGHDGDTATYDWRYSYPADYPPGIKGGFSGWKEEGVWKGHGVFHERWYVVDANDEGMPVVITSTPSFGLDGTMVDINLAIKSQVPHILHIVDGVKVIDIEHSGSGTGLSREEGLIFASEDPVALDLLCARYMFKNVPRDPDSPDLFARGVPVPRYDGTLGAIVTDPGVDLRLLRSTLFDYAAGRGLGKVSYYVKGRDKTIWLGWPRPLLVSKDGHFGRVWWKYGGFRDVMTAELYFHMYGALSDLQPSVLAYAQATDDLTGSNYYGEFMALDEEPSDDIIDDRELGKNGVCDCVLALLGIRLNLGGKGEVDHGTFFYNSRLLKYADPAWNLGRGDWLRVSMDTTAFAVALQMATGPDTGEEGNPNTDPFFGIQYGTGADGVSKWPSLQFARYGLEMSVIYEYMYASAQRTGKGFTLYVPAFPPPPYYNPYGKPNVVETNDPAKVFTVLFADGEEW